MVCSQQSDSCVCFEGDGMSNPAVEVEEPVTSVENVVAADVPSVTFVSGFDSEDDNLMQQRAAAAGDEDVNDEVPLVAAANAESVCTACIMLSPHTLQLMHETILTEEIRQKT